MNGRPAVPSTTPGRCRRNGGHLAARGSPLAPCFTWPARGAGVHDPLPDPAGSSCRSATEHEQLEDGSFPVAFALLLLFTSQPEASPSKSRKDHPRGRAPDQAATPTADCPASPVLTMTGYIQKTFF